MRDSLRFYELAAPVYGFWAALLESRAHQRALAAIGQHARGNVLEVALGTGSESAALSADPTIQICVGVDLSMAMLKQSRHRIRASGGSPVLCRADARALPFRSAAFDALLSCYLLDLLTEREIPMVMGEFARVLSPAGHLVVVVMGRQAPILQALWMAAFHRLPLLVGGCRPVDAASCLARSGWTIERQERITQMGFRSQLFVARPPSAAACK